MTKEDLKFGDLIVYNTLSKNFIRVRNYAKVNGKTEWLIPVAIYCFDGVGLCINCSKRLTWYESMDIINSLKIKNVPNIDFFVGDINLLRKVFREKDKLNDCMQRLSACSIKCKPIENYAFYWSSTEYSSTTARSLSTVNGSVFKDTKDNINNVCAFLAL